MHIPAIMRTAIFLLLAIAIPISAEDRPASKAPAKKPAQGTPTIEAPKLPPPPAPGLPSEKPMVERNSDTLSSFRSLSDRPSQELILALKHDEEFNRKLDEVVQLLKKSLARVESDFVSCAGNDRKKLLAFIAQGVSVNSVSEDGKTALINAAEHGNTDVVNLLLKHGANVAFKTKSGDTALKVATKGGHKDIVALLQKSGAKE